MRFVPRRQLYRNSRWNSLRNAWLKRYALDCAKIQTCVFEWPVSVRGQVSVRMKSFYSNLHDEFAIIAVSRCRTLPELLP